MLDNYDSFTYNLVRYFRELGAEVVVYRNDEISLADIEQLAPTHIVISPGPCTPNEAGNLYGCDSSFCWKNTTSRRVFRPPEYWSGIWWQGSSSRKSDARKNLYGEP